MTKSRICGIWKWNRDFEMKSISECLKTCSFIAIDTEFPGCLKQTDKEANEEDRYRDMKFNVDKTKLIQLGLTLFEKDEIRGTWEVNFSDFDEKRDAKNENSIAFLRSNNLDLDKIKHEGISMKEFFREFVRILDDKKKRTWITFDGSYDMAYLLKGLIGGFPLPETSKEFREVTERFIGRVLDAQKITDLCTGLNCRFGLQRIADLLHIKREGEAHHAGSDSQLTADVFISMLNRYNKKKCLEAEQKQQNIQDPSMIHHPVDKKVLSETYQKQHELMLYENYKRMRFEAHQKQQHIQHIQDHRMMTKSYVPRSQPRPRPMTSAYKPFG